MTNSPPLVSVLIPAYNTTYFKLTLESALAQDFADLEVVVCDDSPGSDIQAICSQFNDPRLVYKRNPKNLGFHGNFTHCFHVARGAFIKFLNDDDILMPDCVSQMVPYLQNESEGITLVASKRTVIGERGETLPDVQATVALAQKDTVFDGFDMGNQVLVNSINFIGEPTTAMFRKSDLVVEPSGLFDFKGHRYTIFADVCLWLRLLSKGRCAYIVKPLSQFRVHRGQEQAKSSNAAGVVVERFDILESARSIGFLKVKEHHDLAKKRLLGIIDMALKSPAFGAADKARFTQMQASLKDAPPPQAVKFEFKGFNLSNQAVAQPTISYGFSFKAVTSAPTAATTPAPTPPATPAAALDEAIALHKQGRLDEAERRYLKLIADQPQHADALQYLGMLHLQRGQTAQGVVRIKEALDRDPNHFAALSNLANVLIDEHDHQGALSLLERAAKLRPENAVIWYGLARAHLGLEQLPQAIADFKQTLALKPDFPEALVLLAKTHFSLRETEQAETVAKRALAFAPNDPYLNYFCGYGASARADEAEALVFLDRAVQADPAMADAWYLKGLVHQKLNQNERALDALQRCLAHKPEHIDAALSAALVCIALGRTLDALKWLDGILEREPQHLAAMAEKGQLLEACARPEEARALLKQANESLGHSLSIEFRHAMAGIPRLRYAQDQLEPLRSRLASELADLGKRIHAEPVDKPENLVGEVQPFYLAYQELNNRELLSQYGQLCVDLMAQWSAKQAAEVAPLNRLPKTANMRRIGIYSAHVQEQSVWRAIVRGWVCEIDRSQFELFIFYPGTQFDQQTQLAKDRADGFWHGHRELGEWVRCIQEANLDVLIYPELGMDRLTAKLASLRLAPVQVASWGHPETTGLPTIDYYLSSDLMEAPSAQDYYSEQLVRLPHLGCCFESLAATPEAVNLGSLGINPDATVFVCPGTPFKYMPEYDQVLVNIAQRIPNAQFVFLSFGPFAPLPDLLMARLTTAFEQAGLTPSAHLRLIPWQTRPAFYGLLKQAHVFLDTIGFSGFNTVMHAIDCGTPIVTVEGPFMRGRFGSAILHRIGLSEFVCRNVDQYVDLAVKLAQDATLGARMRTQIEAGRSSLYGDKAPIRALEQFLLKATDSQAA